MYNRYIIPNVFSSQVSFAYDALKCSLVWQLQKCIYSPHKNGLGNEQVVVGWTEVEVSSVSKGTRHCAAAEKTAHRTEGCQQCKHGEECTCMQVCVMCSKFGGMKQTVVQTCVMLLLVRACL